MSIDTQYDDDDDDDYIRPAITTTRRLHQDAAVARTGQGILCG
jgi:hypothetical protein